jgi:hypothetical protein
MGSSTGGVMKSAVVINAVSLFNRYTPASSLVSNPTIKFGSRCTGNPDRSASSPTGLNFAAQPQVFDKLVSVGFLNRCLIAI